MPSHSPSSGQSTGVALVSGPRTVRLILPCSLVTTSSERLSAIERKVLAPSLWQRHTRSTKGESDILCSSKKIMFLPPIDQRKNAIMQLIDADLPVIVFSLYFTVLYLIS
jgi:hypothetical protein